MRSTSSYAFSWEVTLSDTVYVRKSAPVFKGTANLRVDAEHIHRHKDSFNGSAELLLGWIETHPGKRMPVKVWEVTNYPTSGQQSTERFFDISIGGKSRR